MPFLASLDALPPNDAASRNGLFFQQLHTDWRTLFAELRASRPVLQLPGLVVLANWADVIDMLSRNGIFQVTYGPHMDPSVGPFMMGRDDTELNWRDKSVMRTLLQWGDLPGIRALSADVAAAALAAGIADGKVDVVKTVSRLVPLRIVQTSFGFPGPDDASMLGWSRATQTDMFHNIGNDPAILAACVQAGTDMRAWLRPYLDGRRPWAEAAGEDTVSRLLRLTATGLTGMDAEAVVTNICGLLVGAIETTSQAIVNATEQILLNDAIRTRAVAAATGDDPTAIDPIVWEALRFNPQTPVVVRVAAAASVVAPGSPNQLAVQPGQVIMAGIGSAMFDPGVFPDPDGFHDRPRRSYLHTGFGAHECLGAYVGDAMVPETVRQILRLPGISLLPDGGSRIDTAGGPFAESFLVATGT
jgi:cytochrome P450